MSYIDFDKMGWATFWVIFSKLFWSPCFQSQFEERKKLKLKKDFGEKRKSRN
jgi:hypothetical protein